MPRLYGRSHLVQTLLEKQQFEDQLDNFDKSEWYSVNVDSLPLHLRSSFVQLEPDQETESFLDHCREVSDSLCLQLFYDMASALLSLFYTKTCINGILGRGIMFIFSTAQLARLLFDSVCDRSGAECVSYSSTSRAYQQRGAVLDLGAGDGNITEKFRPYFDTLYATEASPTMQRRLRDRGVKILSIDDWWRVDKEDVPRFRLISCLNLLDRHARPLTLLQQLHAKAKADDALVLLAVVLPWSQFVEYQVEANRDASNRPAEMIVLEGESFEAQMKQLVENVLQPNGFRVVRWTRLPYLCEGDLNRSVYWLDDTVLLLKTVDHDAG